MCWVTMGASAGEHQELAIVRNGNQGVHADGSGKGTVPLRVIDDVQS